MVVLYIENRKIVTERQALTRPGMVLIAANSLPIVATPAHIHTHTHTLGLLARFAKSNRTMGVMEKLKLNQHLLFYGTPVPILSLLLM